jgi:hypothetical protein
MARVAATRSGIVISVLPLRFPASPTGRSRLIGGRAAASWSAGVNAAVIKRYFSAFGLPLTFERVHFPLRLLDRMRQQRSQSLVLE